MRFPSVLVFLAKLLFLADSLTHEVIDELVAPFQLIEGGRVLCDLPLDLLLQLLMLPNF